MAYTVKELAKLSNVSVRTLHFYDEIGLLKPAYVGDNGYRYYEKEQLLLLQQILFYRELGFPLSEIQKVMGRSDFDKIKALKAHRKQIVKDATRVNTLLLTLDKTIQSLEGGKEMKPNDLYKGFDPKKQAEYEQYWIETGGELAKKWVEESRENTKNWKKADYDAVAEKFLVLDKILTKAIVQNIKPRDPRVQEVVKEHYALIQKFYQPTKESYTGLGEMYVTHSDFRKRYDVIHPILAEYWAKAMKYFAENELK